MTQNSVLIGLLINSVLNSIAFIDDKPPTVLLELVSDSKMLTKMQENQR